MYDVQSLVTCIPHYLCIRVGIVYFQVYFKYTYHIQVKTIQYFDGMIKIMNIINIASCIYTIHQIVIVCYRI